MAENYWSFFHRWSKWEEEKNSPVTRVNASGKTTTIGYFIVQKRTCARCGLVERTKQELTI